MYNVMSEVIYTSIYSALNFSVQCRYTGSITDILTVSPLGLMRSPLTVLNIRESYINVTWTPSPSQQGANMFCYTATDNFGYMNWYIE